MTIRRKLKRLERQVEEQSQDIQADHIYIIKDLEAPGGVITKVVIEKVGQEKELDLEGYLKDLEAIEKKGETYITAIEEIDLEEIGSDPLIEKRINLLWEYREELKIQ